MSGLWIEFVLWAIAAWAFGWAGYTARSAMRPGFSGYWRFALCLITAAEVAFGALCGALALDVHITRLLVP